MKQMRNMKAPLFVILALVGLAVAALFFFSGKSKETEQTPATTPSDDLSATTSTASPTDALDFPSMATMTPVSNGTAIGKGSQPDVVSPFGSKDGPMPSTVEKSTVAPGKIESRDKPTEVKELPKDQPKAESLPSNVVAYEIKPGDMIALIAKKYGCSTSEVFKLNGLNDESARRLKPGKVLNVIDRKGMGSNTTLAAKPVVVSPDATSTVKASTPSSATTTNEPSQPIVEKSKPDTSTARTHLVERGDHYFRLSIKYYGSPAHWRLIRDANPSWDPFTFVPNKTIVIPALRASDAASVANVKKEHEGSKSVSR